MYHTDFTSHCPCHPDRRMWWNLEQRIWSKVKKFSVIFCLFRFRGYFLTWGSTWKVRFTLSYSFHKIERDENRWWRPRSEREGAEGNWFTLAKTCHGHLQSVPCCGNCEQVFRLLILLLSNLTALIMMLTNWTGFQTSWVRPRPYSTTRTAWSCFSMQGW